MARKGWPSILQRKVYFTCDGQLRLNIVKAHHDYLISGHPSWWKMMELVAHNFVGQGWAAT